MRYIPALAFRASASRATRRASPDRPIEPYPQSRYPRVAPRHHRSLSARIDRSTSHATRRREDTYGDDFFAAVVFTLAVTLIEEAVMENIVGANACVNAARGVVARGLAGFFIVGGR